MRDIRCESDNLLQIRKPRTFRHRPVGAAAGLGSSLMRLSCPHRLRVTLTLIDDFDFPILATERFRLVVIADRPRQQR